MLLPIVKYGRPILRKKGELIRPERENLRQLIDDMLETMRHAKGVGLAAQQIGQAIQLTVIDIREAKETTSEMWINDQPSTINKHMPMILLNPKITPLNASIPGQEGCLSFPEIYGDVLRPEQWTWRRFIPTVPLQSSVAMDFSPASSNTKPIT